MKEDISTISPKNQQEWRQWLIENHASAQAVWLLAHKKSANKATISWSEMVDEALCFGWIDSVRKSVSDESFVQFLCKRKPKSGWSKINKEKVERLIADGLMAEAGFKSIEIAKQNGSWNLLDEIEELTIPVDLDAAFVLNAGAKEFFLGLSKTVRKMMLQWIAFAKRPETRQKRINEIAELAARKIKPKQF